MGLITLTEKVTSTTFRISNTAILRVEGVSEAADSKVTYIDEKGARSIVVDESPSEIAALATNLIAVTVSETTVYINAEKIVLVEEVEAGSKVVIDSGVSKIPLVIAETPSAVTALIATATGGGLPYKFYIGVVSQSGTNAPAVTIPYNVNTLGDLEFVRISTGVYEVQSNALFTSKAATVLSLTPGNATAIIRFYWTGFNTLRINTRTVANVLSDGLLSDASFEIKVYN